MLYHKPVKKIYISETGHSIIKTRLKEHYVGIHHCMIKNYVVVQNSHNTNHQICLKNVKVLATIPHYYKRKVRESLEIEKYPNNINPDDGLKLKTHGGPSFNS